MDSATTVEALAEEEEDTMRHKDQRQRWMQRRIEDVPEESSMTMEALAEEDDHKDYNNNKNGVVVRG